MKPTTMHDNSSPEYQEFSEYLHRLRRDELAEYLAHLHEPVWECELMRVAFPEANLITGTPLQMYRWHFVLFHVLYSLAPEFANRGLYLHIHFMRTCVKKYPEPSFCRHFDEISTNFCDAKCVEESQLCDFHFQRTDETAINSLSDQYFYLDWENFTSLGAESAEKFINGAWNLLQNQENYRRCLAIMGLPEGVSIDLLKKRFRHLAKTMHPDLNAVHHNEFAKINTAYRSLLKYLGN